MDILRSTFDTSVPFLLSAIQSCDFIAIDTEFTGLSADAQDQSNAYDTTDMRYQKIRRLCMKFWACQLGICTFTYEGGKVIARPFNVYLLPAARERSITCNVGSMSFLSEHNFNFSTLFTEGLAVTRLEDLLSTIETVQKSDEPHELSQLSHEHSQFLAGVKEELVEFAQHPSKVKDLHFPTPYLTGLFFSKQGLADKFTGLAFERLKTGTEAVSTTIRVKKAKSKKKTPGLNERTANTDTDWAGEAAACARLSLATAGTIVVSALIKAKKPIVGHHFSLDLGFIINQFVTEMPETYAEYQEVVKSLFPTIFDTKYVATQSILKDKFGGTNLERITLMLADNPAFSSIPSVVIDPDPKFRRYHSGSAPHEAGYDAYMTGLDLNGMGYMLLQQQEEPPALTVGNFWKALKPFENKVHLSNHFRGCLDFNLHCSEREELRDVRFKYVLAVQADLDIHALAKVLSAYGDVRVVRNSDREFLVRYEQLGSGLESLDAVVVAIKQEAGLEVCKMANNS